MSLRFYGSICLTDLVEFAHKKHSGLTKAENGKIYANCTLWLNDEKDKFGNTISLQLNPKKDLKEQYGQPYIGNFKEAEAKQISSRDASSMTLPDDIPASEKSKGINTDDIKDPIDDLPF